MSCFYSQGYCLCCLFAADGEAGEVVEVDDTEAAVAVDDGISSVDGDMDVVCEAVDGFFDCVGIEGEALLLAVDGFEAELGVSLAGVVPVEEVCAFYAIELDEVALDVFLDEPFVYVATLEVLKGCVEFGFVGAVDCVACENG